MTVFVFIDTTQNLCVAQAIWGQDPWITLPNCVPQLSDGTINVGDNVQLVNGTYVYLSSN
jgi:hypothetical protein